MAREYRPQDFSIDPVNLRNALDRIAEKLDAVTFFVFIRGNHIDNIATHAEGPALELDIVPRIVDFRKRAKQIVSLYFLPNLHAQHLPRVFIRRANAINAAHRCDDNNIAAPIQERARRLEAQPVYFIVDGEIFLDKRICRWNVRFGLIIIVIGNKKLDGIIRKKLLELAEELCGKTSCYD